MIRGLLTCEPLATRRFHGWAAIVWLVASVPIMLFLRDSVAVVVLMSAYAIVTGHWAAYQASRVEVKQDEAASGGAA